MKRPYIYFGGKSKIMENVWLRLWSPDVKNIVDPFFGGGSTLFNAPYWNWQTLRPTADRMPVESVNDLDPYLSNFWRATATEEGAAQVAHYCDWPVNECVPEGTLISTPTGNIPIENIRPGMTVWGEKEGEVVETTVIATKQNRASKFVEIDDLLITGNHPVWTLEQGYIEAQLLAGNLHIGKIRHGRKAALGNLPINHIYRQSIRGDRSINKPGDQKGLSLPRVSFAVPKVVFNFQTTTGNYFANEILVHNCDLHARHWWLVNQAEFRQRMKDDPDYYNPKIAGWWVWGINAWIGSGWCKTKESQKRPHLGNPGQGVHRPSQKRPHLGNPGQGVHRPSQQRPHLGNPGQGVHRPSQQLPHLGNPGRGVHRPSQQRPHLGDPGQGVHRPSQQRPHLGDPGQGHLHEYFQALRARFRYTRVCCGDFERVLGPSVTFKHGLTAVILDPPYLAATGRKMNLYATDTTRTDKEPPALRARLWALENGDNPLLRIALFGYASEHDDHMPATWERLRWSASGGFDGQRLNGINENRHRETVWFSPHCKRALMSDLPLFAELSA